MLRLRGNALALVSCASRPTLLAYRHFAPRVSHQKPPTRRPRKTAFGAPYAKQSPFAEHQPTTSSSSNSNDPTLADSEWLSGNIERVLFRSEDNGYTVLKLKLNAKATMTVVGNFLQKPIIGQTLQVKGEWGRHYKFGKQFTATASRMKEATSTEAVESYLSSGLLPGIGAAFAKRIVSHFGLDTLTVLDKEPERLSEVSGLGAGRMAKIHEAWTKHRQNRDTLMFFAQHQISPGLSRKLVKEYRDQAVDILSHNPYQIIHLPGVGFQSADRVARSMGMPPNSKYRIKGAIIHSLSVALDAGHSFLPKEQMLKKSCIYLATEQYRPKPADIEPFIDELLLERHIVSQPVDQDMLKFSLGSEEKDKDKEKNKDKPSETSSSASAASSSSSSSSSLDLALPAAKPLVYYKQVAFWAEYGLANALLSLMHHPAQKVKLESRGLSHAAVHQWMADYAKNSGIVLSAEQQRAVELATLTGVCIITGGPGCGKTFTLRAIVDCWNHFGLQCMLTSPTGRGAHRMAELAGQEAKTIHRTLQYMPGSDDFEFNERKKLETDAVVVDEVSMVDLFLMQSLVKSIPMHASVVLVGDADQLPSVGPGNVLKDLIASGVVSTVQLTSVFRQAQSSAIISNAHCINKGFMPPLEIASLNPQSDCLWINSEDPQPSLDWVLDELLPKMGFDPLTQLQVLSPVTQGEGGTKRLNARLQQRFSPGDEVVIHGDREFRVGDRVMQKVNDYTRNVFNGEIGVVEEVDAEDKMIKVRYRGRDLETYEGANDLDELSLAWAVTIHKSQGSEYDVVVMMAMMNSSYFLSRPLLYTGLTRARKLAVIIGPRKALRYAVEHEHSSSLHEQRYSLLDWRLQQPYLHHSASTATAANGAHGEAVDGVSASVNVENASKFQVSASAASLVQASLDEKASGDSIIPSSITAAHPLSLGSVFVLPNGFSNFSIGGYPSIEDLISHDAEAAAAENVNDSPSPASTSSDSASAPQPSASTPQSSVSWTTAAAIPEAESAASKDSAPSASVRTVRRRILSVPSAPSPIHSSRL